VEGKWDTLQILRKEMRMRMQFGVKRIRTGRIPYLPLFIVGLMLGTIVMNAGKALLLEGTGLLDEYTLYQMKYMTVDSNALFVYVLGQRMKVAAILVIMATTYLGLIVSGGVVFWYGMSTGMFLSAVVIRYGLKGILFALIGIFPQFLFYVPAVVILIVWCEDTCRSIYFRGGITDGIRRLLPKKLLQLLIIVSIMAAGCILESYVNPYFVSKLLKIF